MRRLRATAFLPFLLLLLMVLLFFHRLAFTDLILARGDIFLYFYPYWEAAAAALRAGRIPLWNPYLFMGAPLLANSQVGFFYPLNWPLWWRLSPPQAVSATILIHLPLAAWGAYATARRHLQLSRQAGTLAALFFALGGYLTAQVEHINQLQGLAWLPWLLLAAGDGQIGSRREGARRVLALALLFALQLAAGHTQTSFISGAGVIVWLVAFRAGRSFMHSDNNAEKARPWAPFAVVALGGLLAVLLVAVQVLPTLQLAQLSSRSAGLPLNEVLSFSLHPLLLARAILPAYGQSLFTEYVAFLPLTALLLAAAGGWEWRRRPGVLAALVLVALGLFLALGQFNPLAVVLAYLPGFSFFRVPARWLALYALGMAFVAGAGWDAVLGQGKRAQRPLLLGVLLLLLLGLWSLAAVPLARLIATGVEAPVEAPSALTFLGWIVELFAAYVVLSRWPRHRFADALLASLALVALFAASRTLPYNRPTTPAAYTALRPPVARLQALQRCDLLPQMCRQPPGRLLSLSNIFFDPGDQVEISAAYGEELTAAALYDIIIAVKQKEIIAPNLPLAYGLFSVDGFDGGILPLRAYTQVTRLILPAGVASPDGRLREYMDAVPAARWLDLFNVRHLITDKVAGNVWRREVFFDIQHPVTVQPGATVPVSYLPEYEATEIWLIAGEDPGIVRARGDGEAWRLQPEALEENLWRVVLPQPVVLTSLSLEANARPWQVHGLALVDSRDGTFQTLVPGAYRLIYSGDVKIYENLDVLSRAFLVYGWQWQPDVNASVRAMADASFDPAATAILVGEGEAVRAPTLGTGRVEIVDYDAERVTLRTESDREALLVLSDAYYPGWQARLDGEEVPIYQADGLFRALFVPAGRHDVVFTYAPPLYRIGRWVSLLAGFLWLVLFVATLTRR